MEATSSARRSGSLCSASGPRRKLALAGRLPPASSWIVIVGRRSKSQIVGLGWHGAVDLGAPAL